MAALVPRGSHWLLLGACLVLCLWQRTMASFDIENCPLKVPMSNLPATEEKRKAVLLLSYGGSGNSWFRNLLEYSTGIYTGSVIVKDKTYDENTYLGEYFCNSSQLVVKGHPDYFTIVRDRKRGNAIRMPVALSLVEKDMRRKCGYAGVPFFEKILFITRNPYESLMSDYNLVQTGFNHTGLVYASSFRAGSFIADVSAEAREINRTFYENIQPFIQFAKPEDFKVVRYKDAMNRSKTEDLVAEMIEFLGLTPDRQRIRCAISLGDRATIHRTKSSATINITYAYTKIFNTHGFCDIVNSISAAATQFQYPIYPPGVKIPPNFSCDKGRRIPLSSLTGEPDPVGFLTEKDTFGRVQTLVLSFGRTTDPYVRHVLQFSTQLSTGAVMYGDRNFDRDVFPGEWFCSKDQGSILSNYFSVMPAIEANGSISQPIRFLPRDSLKPRCSAGKLTEFKKFVVLIRNPFDTILEDFIVTHNGYNRSLVHFDLDAFDAGGFIREAMIEATALVNQFQDKLLPLLESTQEKSYILAKFEDLNDNSAASKSTELFSDIANFIVGEPDRDQVERSKGWSAQLTEELYRLTANETAAAFGKLKNTPLLCDVIRTLEPFNQYFKYSRYPAGLEGRIECPARSPDSFTCRDRSKEVVSLPADYATMRIPSLLLSPWSVREAPVRTFVEQASGVITGLLHDILSPEDASFIGNSRCAFDQSLVTTKFNKILFQTNRDGKPKKPLNLAGAIKDDKVKCNRGHVGGFTRFIFYVRDPIDVLINLLPDPFDPQSAGSAELEPAAIAQVAKSYTTQALKEYDTIIQAFLTKAMKKDIFILRHEQLLPQNSGRHEILNDLMNFVELPYHKDYLECAKKQLFTFVEESNNSTHQRLEWLHSKFNTKFNSSVCDFVVPLKELREGLGYSTGDGAIENLITSCFKTHDKESRQCSERPIPTPAYMKSESSKYRQSVAILSLDSVKTAWLRALIENLGGFVTGSAKPTSTDEEMSLFRGEEQCSQSQVAIAVSFASVKLQREEDQSLSSPAHFVVSDQGLNTKCSKGGVSKFGRVLYLATNPFESLMSENHLKLHDSNRLEVTPRKTFESKTFLHDMRLASASLNESLEQELLPFIRKSLPEQFMVVKFEEMLNPVNRKLIAKKILEFLGVHFDESRFECAFQFADRQIPLAQIDIKRDDIVTTPYAFGSVSNKAGFCDMIVKWEFYNNMLKYSKYPEGMALPSSSSRSSSSSGDYCAEKLKSMSAEERCREFSGELKRIPVEAGLNRDRMALISIDTDLSTWFRYVLEQSSGVVTGSISSNPQQVMHEGRLFEDNHLCSVGQLFVRAQPQELYFMDSITRGRRKEVIPATKFGISSVHDRRKCAHGFVQMFDRAIFVIRNPYDLLLMSAIDAKGVIKPKLLDDSVQRLTKYLREVMFPFITKANPASFVVIRYEPFFAQESTPMDVTTNLDTATLRRNVTAILSYLQLKNLDEYRIDCAMNFMKSQAAVTEQRTVPLPKIIPRKARDELLSSQAYYCLTLPFVLKYNEVFHYDLLPPASGISCAK